MTRCLMLVVLAMVCLNAGSAWCPAAEDEAPVVIRDDFDQALKLDWEVVRSEPTHFSTVKAPGRLTITTQDGTIHLMNRTPPPVKNLVLLENPMAEGDGFVVTTCLDGFAPTMPFQQAGLIIYQDDDNYAKWVYQFSTSRKIIWNLLRETDGASDLSKSLFYYDTKKKVWLRLTARGNHFEFACSDDGEAFVTHGELPWGTAAAARIGLIATNGGRAEAHEIDARFDFFEIRSLNQAERDQPAFAERRAIAGSWDVVSCETAGKPIKVAGISGFVFGDTKVTIRDKQSAASFAYTLDSTQQPKTIHLAAFTGEGTRPAPGIYSRDGDSLQICLELESKTESPDAFETKEGDRRMLMKLKRAQPGE